MGTKKYICNDKFNEYVPIMDSLEYKIQILLSEQLNKWINDIEIKFHQKIDVCFFINNNSSINAGVGKDGTNYYLYLNLGLLRGIRDFTNNVFLTDINDSELDVFFGEYENNYIDFFEDEKDPKASIANTICINILHSVFFHELGHLFLGHLEGGGTVAELNSETDTSCLDRQCMEYIADSFGTHQAFWVVLFSIIYTQDMSAYVEVTTLFLLSQYCMFNIFDIQKRGLNIETKQLEYDMLLRTTHPHPCVRFVYTLDIIQEAWINWLSLVGKLSFEEAEKIAQNIISSTLDDYFHIINQYTRTNLRDDMIHKDVLEVVANIKVRAAELHKDKVKFAIAPLIDIVSPSQEYLERLSSLSEFGD